MSKKLAIVCNTAYPDMAVYFKAKVDCMSE